MTIPPPPTPLDQGNQFLAETPAQLTTSLAGTPQGQRLALTIRTSSTTLTVLLSAADAATWARQLTTTAGQMSKTGLVIAGNGHIPLPRQGH